MSLRGDGASSSDGPLFWSYPKMSGEVQELLSKEDVLGGRGRKTTQDEEEWIRGPGRRGRNKKYRGNGKVESKSPNE